MSVISLEKQFICQKMLYISISINTDKYEEMASFPDFENANRSWLKWNIVTSKKNLYAHPNAGYGMTLGFPTIVIPAIQGGEGRSEGQSSDIVLNKEEISWFSKSGYNRLECSRS